MELQIQKFGTTTLRVEEVFGFFFHVNEEATALLPTEVSANPPLIVPTVVKFNLAFKEFDDALKESAKLAGSSAKTIADENRGMAWRKMYAYLKAMEGSPNTLKAKSAVLVKNLFNKYGCPTNLPYAEETGILVNLLQDLNAVNQSTKELLDLEEWTKALKDANDEFVAALEVVVIEKSSRITGLIKTKRKECEKMYQTLVNVVNSMIIVQGEEYYRTFVEHLNVMIDEQKTVLRRRSTLNAKKDNEGEIIV